jgi:hypothetical protein
MASTNGSFFSCCASAFEPRSGSERPCHFHHMGLPQFHKFGNVLPRNHSPKRQRGGPSLTLIGAKISQLE